jgi:WD40 repeat protein
MDVRRPENGRESLELLARTLTREQAVLAEEPTLLPGHLLQALRLGEREVPETLVAGVHEAMCGRTWLELLERPGGFTSGLGEISRWELGAPVSAVSVSPSGAGLATLRLDGRLQLRLLPWALPAWETQAHEGAAEDLDWARSGRFVATADDAGAIAIWNARTGVELGRWSAHEGQGPTTVRWGPDDALVVSAGADGAIRFWRLEDRGDRFEARNAQEMRSQDASPTSAVEWSPDGRRFAAAGREGIVRVWGFGCDGLELLSELDDNACGVFGLAWDPASTRLASSAADGAVVVWRLGETPGRRLEPAEGSVPARSIAWSPDGARIAFDADAYRLGIVDPDTMDLAYLTGHRHLVFSVRWTPDGRLVSASTDWTVRLWDPAAAEPQSEAERGHRTLIGGGIALSHDGDRLASGDYGSTIYASIVGGDAEVHPCDLRLWWTATGAAIHGQHETYVFRGVTAVGWSPDDRLVVVCCRDGSVATLDADTGVGRERWLGAMGEVWAATWGAEGRVITAGQDGEISLWGDERALARHSAGVPVRALASSPDGARIAAGCDDGSLVCLSAADLSELWALPAHDGRVHRVTWSEDGRNLVSAGEDGLVRVWNAHDATPLADHRHGNQVYDAAFVPPAGWVCSGGDGGELDLWGSTGLVARSRLPGSVGAVWVSGDGSLHVASHGSENGFRPVVYRFALHSPTG